MPNFSPQRPKEQDDNKYSGCQHWQEDYGDSIMRPTTSVLKQIAEQRAAAPRENGSQPIVQMQQHLLTKHDQTL
jgi:hypothetical protein